MRTLTSLRLFTALFAFMQVTATIPAHAGPTDINPANIQRTLESTAHAHTFDENINLINKRLTDLIAHVREMRHIGKVEDLVTAKISTTCTKLQEELKIPHIEFAQLLTEHIGTLLSMSIAPSIAHIKKEHYRENARSDDTEETPTLGGYASTRTLAASLDNIDLMTLALTARINAAVSTQNRYKEAGRNELTSGERAVFSAPTLTDNELILLCSMITSMPLGLGVGIASHSGIIVGMGAGAIFAFSSIALSVLKSEYVLDKAKRIRDQTFNYVIESLASQLQSTLGEAAAPLIAAIRTGDGEALRSATCQFHLTPQPLQRVRVETEAAQQTETASGAAAQQAEVHEVINSAPVQRRYEVVPRP